MKIKNFFCIYTFFIFSKNFSMLNIKKHFLNFEIFKKDEIKPFKQEIYKNFLKIKKNTKNCTNMTI